MNFEATLTEVHMATMGFETTDLGLASYLKAKGLSLEGTRRMGSRTVFIFVADPRIAEWSRDFFNGPMRQFVNAMRDLKDLLHSRVGI